VLVGRLSSPKTEIPYDFYELNWCNNTANEGYDLNPVHKNIKGTDLVQSPVEYTFGVRRDRVSCWKDMSATDVELFRYAISHGYTYRLYLDDLPSATIKRSHDDK